MRRRTMKNSIPKLNVKVVETSRSDSDPTYHDLQFYFDLSDVKKLPGYTPCLRATWMEVLEFNDEDFYEYGTISYHKRFFEGRTQIVFYNYIVALYVPKGVWEEQRWDGSSIPYVEVSSCSDWRFELASIGQEISSPSGSYYSSVKPFSLDITFFYKEHPEIQQTITITI